MVMQRLMIAGRSARGLALAATVSRTQLRYSSTGPATVADASFWKSLVPKPLRKENRSAWSPRSGQWNPATFFIVMFLFIGSMSIQQITLRNSFDRYMRQSTLRIGKLREVVERIQRGEEVDVEKALGTGDAKTEVDWEEGRCSTRHDHRTVLTMCSPPKYRARGGVAENPKKGEGDAIPTSAHLGSCDAGRPAGRGRTDAS